MKGEKLSATKAQSEGDSETFCGVVPFVNKRKEITLITDQQLGRQQTKGIKP
jgi:hypothetical protein